MATIASMLAASAGPRSGPGQPVQLGAHLLLAAGPLGRDQRRVEAAVPHPPREVADHRVAHLGGRDQAVERCAVLVARGRRQRGRG